MGLFDFLLNNKNAEQNSKSESALSTQKSTQTYPISKVNLEKQIKCLDNLGDIFFYSSALRATGVDRCEKMRSTFLSYKCILLHFYENVYNYGHAKEFLNDEGKIRYALTASNIPINYSSCDIVSTLPQNWPAILQSIAALKASSESDYEKLAPFSVTINDITKSLEIISGRKIKTPLGLNYNPFKITDNPDISNGHTLPNMREVFLDELSPLFRLVESQNTNLAEVISDYTISMIKSYFENAGYVPMCIVDSICTQIGDVSQSIAVSTGQKINYGTHRNLKIYALDKILY